MILRGVTVRVAAATTHPDTPTVVTITVNGHTAELTPREAQWIARAILADAHEATQRTHEEARQAHPRPT